MPRILYVLLSQDGVQGGHKMVMRHVETLCDLGFEAACYIGVDSKAPTWFEHKAPLEFGTPVRVDDIVVVPDDAEEALATCAASTFRTLVFSQNPYYFAASAVDKLELFAPDRFPTIIASGPRLAATLRRLLPQAAVEVVPCFADERRFSPAAAKRVAVAYTPRKRPLETKAIHGLFRRLHPRYADLPWAPLVKASEAEVARGFGGSSLHLSLSRLESVGMTTLEAMASGCVCAGFTGVGGEEYATSDNGFWVPNEDCEAAADALAQAADLTRTGGAPLRRMLDAGHETARQWSYAAFRQALEEVWMRLAPEARLRNGPMG